MGYDMYGRGGVFSTNGSGWGQILDLAEEFGWVAQGAQLRVHAPESGLPAEFSDERTGYFTNDYNLVTDQDSEALAIALCRALRALCSDNRASSSKSEIVNKWLPLTKEARQLLQEAIGFFAAGEFEIG